MRNICDTTIVATCDFLVCSAAFPELFPASSIYVLQFKNKVKGFKLS
jgi:hypothetical protein